MAPPVESTLAEPLIEAQPVLEATRTVDVQAPTELPPGYELAVEQENHRQRTLRIRVPAGGAEEGQVFTAEVINDNIPTGVWRDDTGDWCRLLCCTFWCLPPALGQVMVREGLNACGRPRSESSWSPFQVLLLVYLLYHLINLVLADQRHQWPGWHGYTLPGLLAIAYGAYVALLLYRTRRHVRRRYHIAEACCCEDCCCVVACPWPAVVQLSRHTGDWQRYQAACCSETGLEERV